MHGRLSPRGASRGVRLDALTSLRFFAALAIVTEHSRGVFLSQDVLTAWPLDQAVSFFFVLSGFVLFHVYPDLPDKQAIGRFWLARVARLWPAHLSALLVLLLFMADQIHLLLGSDSLIIVVANLFLVQAWIPLPDFYFSLNAVSWTISTEMGFYLLFPVLILGFRSTWQWKIFVAAALLIGLIVICNAWRIPDYSADYKGITAHGLLYISPLGRLFEFVLGMCCGLMVASPSSAARLKRDGVDHCRSRRVCCRVMVRPIWTVARDCSGAIECPARGGGMARSRIRLLWFCRFDLGHGERYRLDRPFADFRALDISGRDLLWDLSVSRGFDTRVLLPS